VGRLGTGMVGITRWLALAVGGPTLVSIMLTASSAVNSQGWTAFLGGPAHPSYSAGQTSISSGNVAGLVRKWHVAGAFLASPTVADGAVFIGSDTGWFYKLSESTGKVLGKVFLGFQPRKTCGPVGIVDTATVAVDPADHRETVYVGGPDGYLYAFSAATMKLQWKSVIAIPSTTTSDFFDWSSPTVANGKIYIGVASNCEDPLVRGGVIGYDQATGKKFAEFYTVPGGNVGGGVWSSVAVDSSGDVYATTGDEQSGARHYTDSIVKLNGTTLAPIRSFPAGGPFGGSPAIFGAYVGACSKNGVFYAVRRSTMTLAWQQQIGTRYAQAPAAECNAAAVYNGSEIFLAGTGTTIDGTPYRGSVQERNPATGALVWESGLPEGATGSPSMDGGGVIAVGTYDNGAAPNGVYLVRAATGTIVRVLNSGKLDFAQSAFADGWLFTANVAGLAAWGP